MTTNFATQAAAVAGQPAAAATTAPVAPVVASTSGLSEEMRRLIRGEIAPEDKAAKYDSSLEKWWKEYASRKNDEEEEHVADSLLYDERCHLPRMVARPTFAGSADAAQTTQTEKPVVP